MVTITLPDELVHRLEEISRHENRSLAEIVATMTEQYRPAETPGETPDWDMILGVYEDDVTDMSTTVRETMKKYYQEKYGDSD